MKEKMKKNKKQEMIELIRAQESLELKVGKEACFTMNDGHIYLGTFLGEDQHYVYLKNTLVLDVRKNQLDYVKLSKSNICIQTTDKT